MAREHSEKARARAKAWAPDFDAARRPAGLLIPDGIAGLTGRLRETISEWAAAEAAPGRMLPWVPVSFGLGIVGYLAADREPTWWASVTFALLTILVACLVRRRPIPLPVAANLAAMAAGFATSHAADAASCTSDPAASGIERVGCRFRRGSRATRARRPHRGRRSTF